MNGFGVSRLNHLPVIQFNFPEEVLAGALGATATQQYSYRLNVSYAPRDDYLADVAALPPFLLIAGTADEAFVARLYEPTMSAATDRGDYVLVGGVNHLGIVTDPAAWTAIAAFLGKAN